MLAVVLAVGWLLLSWLPQHAVAMSPGQFSEMRKATVDVFRHGFDNYMQHAFPDDEVTFGLPCALFSA